MGVAPSIVFHIPGNPVTKENNYITKRKSKQIFIPKEISNWEDEVHALAIEKMKEAGWPGPWTGRVTVGADFAFKSWHERDITNFWKSVLDALSGAIYDDDSQIDQTFQCRQKSAANPGITIAVWFHDLDLNELGARRPREWDALSYKDFSFPETYRVVTDPTDCSLIRFTDFGDGRKKAEREAAASRPKKPRKKNNATKKKPAGKRHPGQARAKSTSRR